METPLGLRLFAGGGRQALTAGGGLALKADAFHATLRSDEQAEMAEATGTATRYRVLLEGRIDWSVSETSSLSPRVEAGVRRDGGTDVEGVGAELGGGLAYVNTRLNIGIETQGRYLLAHQADGFEEWGAGVTLRVGPGVDGPGPWLALEPQWGAATSRMHALWDPRAAPELHRGIADAPGARPDRVAMTAGYRLSEGSNLSVEALQESHPASNGSLAVRMMGNVGWGGGAARRLPAPELPEQPWQPLADSLPVESLPADDAETHTLFAGNPFPAFDFPTLDAVNVDAGLVLPTNLTTRRLVAESLPVVETVAPAALDTPDFAGFDAGLALSEGIVLRQPLAESLPVVEAAPHARLASLDAEHLDAGLVLPASLTARRLFDDSLPAIDAGAPTALASLDFEDLDADLLLPANPTAPQPIAESLPADETETHVRLTGLGFENINAGRDFGGRDAASAAPAGGGGPLRASETVTVRPAATTADARDGVRHAAAAVPAATPHTGAPAPRPAAPQFPAAVPTAPAGDRDAWPLALANAAYLATCLLIGLAGLGVGVGLAPGAWRRLRRLPETLAGVLDRLRSGVGKALPNLRLTTRRGRREAARQAAREYPRPRPRLARVA